MPSMPLLFRFATGKKQAANRKDISIYSQRREVSIRKQVKR